MNNLQGLTPSVLTVFSGVVSEVDSPSIPAGSSPFACDVDFDVSSVKTRDGIQNVYAYAGASETEAAQSGSNISGPGETPWTNPGNIAHNTPGTYASVSASSVSEILEASVFGFTIPSTAHVTGVEVTVNGKQFFLESGGGGSNVVDVVATNGLTFDTNGTVGPLAPTAGADYGLLFCTGLGSTSQYANPSTPPVGWTGIYTPTPARLEIYSNSVSGSVTPNAILSSTWWVFVGVLALFHTQSGGAVVQSNSIGMATSGAQTLAFGSNLTAGNTVILAIGGNFGAALAPTAISDSLGNTYNLVGNQSELSPFSSYQGVAVYCAQNVIAGACTVSFSVPNVNTYNVWIGEIGGLTGIAMAGGTIEVTPLTLNSVVLPKTASLPLTDGSVTLGSPTDTWGQNWNTAETNASTFGFGIRAFPPPGTNSATCDISGVTVTVWYTPPAVTQFDYIKTFALTDGETLTLALDNTGVFWQEDVGNNPGILTPFYTAIEPDSFAVSVTEDNREFIALSDLQQGTDMPRQYNGEWVDRISQVGPGAPVSITSNQTGYPIVSVAQETPVGFGPIIGTSGGSNGAILASSGPGHRDTGNVLTFFANNGLTWEAGIVPGATIVFAGFSGLLTYANNGGANPAYWTVASVGTAVGSGGLTYNIFTVVTTTNFGALWDKGSRPGDYSSATYQLQMATLTTSVPVPNLGVGQQMAVSGVTPSGWNGTWTVQGTPNGGQYSVNTTSLSGNVATYSFTLVSGALPAVNNLVTITGTTNGGGIFNQVNAIVTSVTVSTFSTALVSSNVTSAPETGNAIISGTKFQFDPLNIIAAGTGGEIVGSGGIGAGTRGAVVMFKTRNGYIPAPSPQTIFTLGSGVGSINVANIPIGPPNTVARIIAFTGANGATQSGGGGFYYWIEQPVTVLDNGQTVTYTATIVNDNTTTQATFSFTDAVLLAATGISVDGNNLFAEIELGSSLGVVAYSDRLFAWGEQNKVQNLLNFSFDGGVGQIAPPPGNPGTSITTYPLAWTLDPTFGGGSSLISSPLFGHAYYIVNASGSTQAAYGMITQPAFQDQLKTPIFESATAYSIRVTASAPSGLTGGNLVVDLFSPSLSQVWGSYTIPFASMTTAMQIFTGTLLTTEFTTVPIDLLIRLYASSIVNGADVEVDRIEPFPTKNPVLSTQLRASYVRNFEAFDQITGNLGVGSQNQQPIRSAFELFDNLYIVKTKSFFSTSDNGTTEPNFWNVRTVSQKVGTPSIHGVDVGEGWALICGEPGLYIFTGGDPVKISPELDGNPGLWQTIRWAYGHTLWIRNDTTQRKVYIGVPIPTPNKWMPHFPANSAPTQPNVVLMMNYKELMTGGALESEGPIRLAYTGELKSYSLGRKWSAWSIEACYADFIARTDTTEPIFFCSDTNPKIYQQIEGEFNDDGAAIPWRYATYPFPKASEAQQFGLGVDMLQAEFMTLTVRGAGNLRMAVYPNTIDSPNAETLYPEPLLDPPSYGDVEIPLGGDSVSIVGNRFFFEFSGLDVGDWMELSKMSVAMTMNIWAPIRGGNG